MNEHYTEIMIDLYNALNELVELNKIKEAQGETEDYLKRKPLAWSNAKRLVAQHKKGYRYWGAKA